MRHRQLSDEFAEVSMVLDSAKNQHLPGMNHKANGQLHRSLGRQEEKVNQATEVVINKEAEIKVKNYFLRFSRILFAESTFIV